MCSSLLKREAAQKCVNPFNQPNYQPYLPFCTLVTSSNQTRLLHASNLRKNKTQEMENYLKKNNNLYFH